MKSLIQIDHRWESVQRCLVLTGFLAFFALCFYAQYAASEADAGGLRTLLVAPFAVLVLVVYWLGFKRYDFAVSQRDSLYERNRTLCAHLHALSFRVNYDDLTGFPNKRLLTERFQEAALRARREKTLLVVYKIGLSNFDAILKTHGGDAGVEIVCMLGERLGCTLRSTDTVVRLENSQFVLVLESIEDQAALAVVNEKLRKALHPDFVIDGNQRIHGEARMAMAQYPEDGDSVEALLAAAQEWSDQRDTELQKVDDVAVHYVEMTHSKFDLFQ